MWSRLILDTIFKVLCLLTGTDQLTYLCDGRLRDLVAKTLRSRPFDERVRILLCSAELKGSETVPWHTGNPSSQTRRRELFGGSPLCSPKFKYNKKHYQRNINNVVQFATMRKLSYLRTLQQTDRSWPISISLWVYQGSNQFCPICVNKPNNTTYTTVNTFVLEITAEVPSLPKLVHPITDDFRVSPIDLQLSCTSVAWTMWFVW